MPEWGALPRGKVVKQPEITKQWVNGRATEDREEWCEEVRLHCEKCYDDKSETSEKQAERIRVQRCRGDSAVAIQGREVQITVNRVLRARGKMLRGKANGPADYGPADCLVVEMLSRLPTEVIYEVTHWFQKRFQVGCRAPEAWRISRLVFLKKPDARLEKVLRGFRAIALLSVFSKWYTTVLVDLLHEEKRAFLVLPCPSVYTKLVCILEASESTRLRMDDSLPNHNEDHLAGKGGNSLQHCNLVHKFIPLPQATKIL